jgi:hypothetical protein
MSRPCLANQCAWQILNGLRNGFHYPQDCEGRSPAQTSERHEKKPMTVELKCKQPGAESRPDIDPRLG